MSSKWGWFVVAVSGLALLASGCGSDSSSTADTTATSGGTSRTTVSSSKGPLVDLTFTGSKSFTAKGTKGRCLVVSGKFGVELTEADYPGIGQSFSMAQLGPKPDIKWVVDDATAYGNSANATITVSEGGKRVEVDDELSPFQVAGKPMSPPEHVQGSITCP